MISGWVCTIASLVAFWAGVWAGRVISQKTWESGWNDAIRFMELQEKEKKEAEKENEDKTLNINIEIDRRNMNNTGDY